MLPLRRQATGLLVVALFGCASTGSKPVDFSETVRDYRATDYPVAYQDWTRHVKLVGEVGTIIEAWATYKSWDFRQAYVANYTSIYDLSDSDRETLKRAQLEASRAGFDFHVSIQMTSDKWNDLDRKSSPWRVTLLDGTGAELGPSSIRAVKLPELYESQFFPNRTEFSRTYQISFVRASSGGAFVGPSSGRIVLRIASPAGRIELVWESR
ncbi:MAG TPA: hypothetical protein VF518_06380 [Polyangia bacterium]